MVQPQECGCLFLCYLTSKIRHCWLQNPLISHEDFSSPHFPHPTQTTALYFQELLRLFFLVWVKGPLCRLCLWWRAREGPEFSFPTLRHLYLYWPCSQWFYKVVTPPPNLQIRYLNLRDLWGHTYGMAAEWKIWTQIIYSNIWLLSPHQILSLPYLSPSSFHLSTARHL